ncbi:MAG: DUF3806 domain-containing protein [Planctomycetes bacterium]|nr:DUF3806 domain-containing protein [Planctomycetota bacterium]
MWSLFRKKRKETEFQTVGLPGDIGSVAFPSDFVVELEEDSTLLTYPKDDDAISLRVSSISFARKDENNEGAAKDFVRSSAEKTGGQYYEYEEKGVHAYEELSEQDGQALLIKYWNVGTKNTIVVFSATILVAKNDRQVVQNTIDLIPHIVASLIVTKTHGFIDAEDRKVEYTEEQVSPSCQEVMPFGNEENDWLRQSLEGASKLGLQYGSGGALTPPELDMIFSRWVNDDEEKESADTIANALGAAFGEYLVDHHAFRWVCVTDEYGTEIGVRHDMRETMAFPRSSVQKRIDDGSTDFFQDVYLIICNQLGRKD